MAQQAPSEQKQGSRVGDQLPGAPPHGSQKPWTTPALCLPPKPHHLQAGADKETEAPRGKASCLGLGGRACTHHTLPGGQDSAAKIRILPQPLNLAVLVTPGHQMLKLQGLPVLGRGPTSETLPWLTVSQPEGQR